MGGGMSHNHINKSNVINLDKNFFLKNKKSNSKKDENQEARKRAEKGLAMAAEKLDW